MNFVYHIQSIEFEWDVQKAEQNVAKHSVAFEEAAEVFLIHFVSMVMRHRQVLASNVISLLGTLTRNDCY
jgi:uncharacterized DUF497 family protein